MQIEELEEENLALKAEHEKWRSDLTALIGRLDQVNLKEPDAKSYAQEEVYDEEDSFASA